MGLRLEVTLLRDEVRRLREDLTRKADLESGDIARIISAEMAPRPYDLDLIAYDLAGIIASGVHTGRFTRKEVIAFLGLNKKENN